MPQPLICRFLVDFRLLSYKLETEYNIKTIDIKKEQIEPSETNGILDISFKTLYEKIIKDNNKLKINEQQMLDYSFMNRLFIFKKYM